ncbi:helix-turn-helix domain-containing protein [Ekhidna sp.]
MIFFVLNWVAIYDGITFLIAIQFLFISILHLTIGERSNNYLAAIALILALGFAPFSIWKLIDSHVVFQVIFGARISILTAPLFFLLIQLKFGHTNQQVKRHLIFPILYIAFFSSIKYFSTHYQNYHSVYQQTVFLVPTIYFGMYFWMARKMLIANYQKRKHQFLIWLYVLFFPLTITFDLLHLIPLWIYKLDPTLAEGFSPLILEIMSYSLTIFYVFFLFYSAAQLDFNKILEKKIDTNQKYPANIDLVFYKIVADDYFKNPSFNLSLASSQFGIPEKKLSEFVQAIYKTTFKEFINTTRVEEFKKIMSLPGNPDKFSIEGMAQLCGFGSRASFYRVFKRKEGMTPYQYFSKKS